MRLKLIFSIAIALALASIALGIVASRPQASATPRLDAMRAETPTGAAYSRRLRVQCDHPAALHLTRFEDGSARLECAHRVLVLVSVPG
jgi:hypothetical protein